MASRISLGRIIEWARNADIEEVDYVAARIFTIIKQRQARLVQADALTQKKTRARKGKHRDEPGDVQPPAPTAVTKSGVPDVGEKAISA